jgi:hypothetical protein
MAGSFIQNPPNLVPTQQQTILSSNYLQWTDKNSAGDFADFAQQYLPELYEQEVERYGNRTLSGFLRMVGAEMPMTSDQVIWSEQNRLHIGYDNVAIGGANGTQAQTFTVTLPVGNEVVVRKNQTFVVQNPLAPSETLKGLITSAPNPGPANVITFEAVCYTEPNFASIQVNVPPAYNLFVYGSDFAKGTEGMEGSVSPAFTQFHNKPIIIKDKYEVNGSDTAQIGWVEVATEDGTSGFLWYMKAESETRLRYEDYLEMAMVEGELAAQGSGVLTNGGATAGTGTQGMFAALNDRGNVYQGFSGAPNAGNGAMADFDAILQQLDLQGAIEENMLFLDRATALDFDDMIATMAGSSFNAANAASYGLFDNEAEMALNFGFSGFRRGSYDFYKTDWKYLNDATTRGLVDNIKGVLIPAGTSTVYDQMLGSNIRRPFLHVRYRASETDDRRMKSWITGSVGGAYTSSLDAMEVHYLSERCLCVQAANNFVLFTAA